MRLIDANALHMECQIHLTDKDAEILEKAIREMIDSAPTVEAVPVDELRELRNWLCETDSITMSGLAKLNKLISEFTAESKQKAETRLRRCAENRRVLPN